MPVSVSTLAYWVAIFPLNYELFNINVLYILFMLIALPPTKLAYSLVDYKFPSKIELFMCNLRESDVVMTPPLSELLRVKEPVFWIN